MSIPKLKSLVKEKFIDIAKVDNKGKGDWVDLSKPKLEPLVKSDPPTKENLFDLVSLAYRNQLKEPHAGLKSPDDVFGGKYDFWEAINIDLYPDADAVLFGKRKLGIKLAGLGHDGKQLSKRILIQELAKLLNKNGYWIEASGRVAEIFLKLGVNIISDQEKIKKIFPNADFAQHFDDGSYIRTGHKSGKLSRNYIFGHPLI